MKPPTFRDLQEWAQTSLSADSPTLLELAQIRRVRDHAEAEMRERAGAERLASSNRATEARKAKAAKRRADAERVLTEADGVVDAAVLQVEMMKVRPEGSSRANLYRIKNRIKGARKGR